MTDFAVYQQINKDHAYWPEKQLTGQTVGGHTAGLLTYFRDDVAIHSILFDAGLGTIQGLTELPLFAWQWPLDVFLTHGHPDHHLELMLFSEIWCKRSAPTRRGPLKVHCTGADSGKETFQFVFPVHEYGYADGDTLTHIPVSSARSTAVGPFTIHAIDVDHFPGSVIYVVEFGESHRHKVVIGWDMKTLPNPKTHTILECPSLALLEANTWEPLSAKTGHTSVTDLVDSGFIANLRASLGPEQYGVSLVHYGGGEDAGGTIGDSALEAKFKATWPSLAPLVAVARRGQMWRFST